MGTVISAKVATLTEAVLKGMLLAKLKAVAVVIIAITTLVGVTSFTGSSQPTSVFTATTNRTEGTSKQDEKRDTLLACASEKPEVSNLKQDVGRLNEAKDDIREPAPMEPRIQTNATLVQHPEQRQPKKLLPGLAVRFARRSSHVQATQNSRPEEMARLTNTAPGTGQRVCD